MAGAVGAGVPLLLKRIGVDPAVASSVTVMTATDVFAFLLFLCIASAAISLIIQGLPHDVAPVATKPHPDPAGHATQPAADALGRGIGQRHFQPGERRRLHGGIIKKAEPFQ